MFYMYVLKSIKDDKITGITILDFKERFMEKSLDLVELPVNINLENLSKRLFI